VKTLLFGLGNELYGDDGVGIRLVRKIKEEAAKKKPSKPRTCIISGRDFPLRWERVSRPSSRKRNVC
jgi:Ni,Fe-hydrogenase maturation factor